MSDLVIVAFGLVIVAAVSVGVWERLKK